MISIDTKLSGDIADGLDRLEAKVREHVIRSGAASMAKVMYDEVKLNTSGSGVKKREKDFVGPMQPSPPGVVSGTLHESVYWAYSPEKSKDGKQVYHVSVNKSKAFYWYWIEYGNSKMAAHSYLRRSLSRMNDAVGAGMQRMKEKMTGGGGQS